MWRELFGFVYGYLRQQGASHFDAEEIAQEALEAAYVNLEGISRGSLRAWLRAVARNRLIDRARRASHTQITAQVPESGDWDADPVRDAIRSADAEAVRAAIGMLCARDRSPGRATLPRRQVVERDRDRDGVFCRDDEGGPVPRTPTAQGDTRGNGGIRTMTNDYENSEPITETARDDLDADAMGFDEDAFIQGAVRKSRMRTVALSAGVVALAAVIAAVGWVGWERLIYHQSNRISVYQYELVALSRPNTHLAGTGRTSPDFPGAVNTYTLFRPVGDRPMATGELVIEYGFWGGESTRLESWLLSGEYASGRTFSGEHLAPALEFMFPISAERARAQREEDPELNQHLDRFSGYTERARSVLASAPPDATGEVAISFDRLMTLSEMTSLVGSDLTLNWGAVDVWGADTAPVTTGPYGNLVGIAFVGPDGLAGPVPPTQLEEDVIDDLRFVASRAPAGTAARCTESANFITEHGVKYYGAVVTGPVDRVRDLVHEARVSAAVLGFVTEAWD